MGTVEPRPEQFEAFVKNAKPDAPVVMINLLKYREQADYAAGSGAEPCTGREAYGRYSDVALKTVAEVGGRVLWMGSVQQTVIAPAGEGWDDAVLVQYPSPADFLRMVGLPHYQACGFHRTAALADSRLIATSTVLGPTAG